MKQIIRRIAALVIGLGLGATALAGLESVTHISDLNSAWPLGSDLASTSDDHIRNIKVALKTDFPNVNAAVTPTPTQFNQLTTDTFTNLAVTSSTIPVNGIYLPAANTLGFASNTTKWGSVNSTGNWVLIAPSSSHTMTLASSASSEGLVLTAPNTASSSFGAIIEAGTNSSDYALRVTNAAVALDYFRVRGDGTILGGGPVAAALVDMTPDTGTFTITYTGFTTGVTATAQWSRIGKLVILNLPSATGTSNAATMTATGLPAAITPATNSPYIAASSIAFQNGGSAGNPGTIDMQVNTAGTITFFLSGGASNWTSSATSKGLSHATQIAYLLN